jgi:arsenate reductase (glutaredoxin)
MDVIIYHNPACGTSRNVLAMIRNSGIEPHIIEYLKCPLTRLLLTQLLARAGLTVRQVLREKERRITSSALATLRSPTTRCSTPLGCIRS